MLLKKELQLVFFGILPEDALPSIVDEALVLDLGTLSRV
jgi:hypothetical protein